MSIASRYSFGGYLATAIPLLLFALMIVLLYLFIDSLSGIGCYFLSSDRTYLHPEMRPCVNGFYWPEHKLSFTLLFLALLSGWFAFFSFKQYSRKVIDGNILKWYLPYLPFLVLTTNIEDYDSKIYIKTYDRHRRIVEGIWLIKNGKVGYEMYGDVFSNLEELGKAIKLPKHIIKTPILSLTLIAYQIGLKRVKL